MLRPLHQRSAAGHERRDLAIARVVPKTRAPLVIKPFAMTYTRAKHLGRNVESWGDVVISVEESHVGSHAVVVEQANGAFWVKRASRSHRTALEKPRAMATTRVRGRRTYCPRAITPAQTNHRSPSPTLSSLNVISTLNRGGGTAEGEELAASAEVELAASAEVTTLFLT